MKANLRKATPEDVDELTALEEVCFIESNISRRSFRYLITKAQATVFVLQVGMKICGCVVVLHRNDFKFARIYSLAVLPEFRGHGFGKALLKQAEVVAKAKCREFMTLEVREDNHHAIKIYQQLNYTIQGKIGDYYEDHVTAIKMVKQLDGF